MTPVLGVHDFRAAVSETLERFRADPLAEPVVVGAYRRPEAVLVPIDRWRAVSDRPRPTGADLAAIRAQLTRSPQERLDGLRRAAEFFDAARPTR